VPQSGAASSDASLIARLRAGDAEVFTELVANVVPALIQYATRWLGDESVANDVVQDVMARLWDKRATLSASTTIRAYLFGAVRNASLNVRKHEHVVRTYAAFSMAGPTSIDTTAPILERITVDQLLAHLPERRREAIVLRYLGELSYAEVAAILGTTPVNAERLVARSLETLRQVVQGWTQPG